MKDSQDGGGRCRERGRGSGIGGGGKRGGADRGSDGGAALWTRGWSGPHPGRRGRRPGNPEFSRDAAARSHARPCPTASVSGRKGCSCGWLEPLSLAWSLRCRVGRTPAPLRGFSRPPSSPGTAAGVLGLNPLHSACDGEMFPGPEGMIGLGLVSMTTGRKRWVYRSFAVLL